MRVDQVGKASDGEFLFGKGTLTLGSLALGCVFYGQEFDLRPLLRGYFIVRNAPGNTVTTDPSSYMPRAVSQIPNAWGTGREVLAYFPDMEGKSQNGDLPVLPGLVQLLDANDEKARFGASQILTLLRSREEVRSSSDYRDALIHELVKFSPQTAHGKLLRLLLLNHWQGEANRSYLNEPKRYRYTGEILEAMSADPELANRTLFCNGFQIDCVPSETNIEDQLRVAETPSLRFWIMKRLLPPTGADSYANVIGYLQDPSDDVKATVLAKLAHWTKRNDQTPDMTARKRGVKMATILEPFIQFWQNTTFEQFQRMRSAK
ncbi:MAG: hypothetical protein ACOYON_05940 [Fimbriimonas sp.]